MRGRGQDDMKKKQLDLNENRIFPLRIEKVACLVSCP